MNNVKRQFIKVLLLVLSLVFVMSSPVLARPDQYIIINKTNPQDVMQYNYGELNSSFASYKGDKSSAGLYLDFYNKIKVGGGYKVYAFHDDTSKIYADMAETNKAYALIKGKNIDGTDTVKFYLAKYTSKTDPRFPDPVLANMPATTTRLIPNSDLSQAPTSELIFTPDIPPVLEAPLSNVTIGDIAPVITGTPAAPILTFNVAPTAAYSTGTATLSEDVSFNIKNAKYDINGTEKQTTPENPDKLMTTALSLLALHDNGSTSITGANLIKNSPVTITVTGANRSAVYTIYFNEKL